MQPSPVSSQEISEPAPIEVVTLDSSSIVDDWLWQRAADPRNPLTPNAAKSYRYIWHSWCRWLEMKRTGPNALYVPSRRFLEATARDIAEFLATGPSPSSARRGKTAAVSDITKRRYWRILDSIYQHAVAKGLLASNPAAGLSHAEKPPRESAEGLVLSRPHWNALFRTLPRGDSALEVRDRAVLTTLLETALTPGEICDLSHRDVVPDPDQPQRLSLHIVGDRSWQNRDLVLTEAGTAVIREWLDARAGMGLSSDVDSLFVTRRHVPLTKRTLFHLVAMAVGAGAKDALMDLPYHIGPQVLRNTRIVLWLNDGVPQADVVRLAGFKDAKSFRGLQRHLSSRIAVPARKALPSQQLMAGAAP